MMTAASASRTWKRAFDVTVASALAVASGVVGHGAFDSFRCSGERAGRRRCRPAPWRHRRSKMKISLVVATSAHQRPQHNAVARLADPVSRARADLGVGHMPFPPLPARYSYSSASTRDPRTADSAGQMAATNAAPNMMGTSAIAVVTGKT